jgi:hypothetical protein
MRRLLRLHQLRPSGCPIGRSRGVIECPSGRARVRRPAGARLGRGIASRRVSRFATRQGHGRHGARPPGRGGRGADDHPRRPDDIDLSPRPHLTRGEDRRGRGSSAASTAHGGRSVIGSRSRPHPPARSRDDDRPGWRPGRGATRAGNPKRSPKGAASTRPTYSRTHQKPARPARGRCSSAAAPGVVREPARARPGPARAAGKAGVTARVDDLRLAVAGVEPALESSGSA